MNTNIVICGKEFDIGTKVVLWDDSHGLNGYDTTKYEHKSQNRKTGKTKIRVVKGHRFNKRTRKIRSIETLKKIITQMFIHHDGLYRSATTFHVLHIERGLSCTFLLDDNGTIYQTLDVFENAWQSGICNPMSIGIEIASRAVAGKYPNAYNEKSRKRHRVESRKKRYDIIHGEKIYGYEYNDKQYKALIKLGIFLSDFFPLIGGHVVADFPRKNGEILKTNLLKPIKHHGFICHYQASSHKIDPISFDHDRFLNGVWTKNSDVLSTFDKIVEDLFSTWMERQEWLSSLGYSVGVIDGIYGPKTKKALKQFQRDNMLFSDGFWGLNTRQAMLDLI